MLGRHEFHRVAGDVRRIQRSRGYVLRLTADDSQGVSADDITITVNPKVNQAPLVNAGPDQSITLPAVATLTRTVSDDGLPSGTIAIVWSQVSGPAPASFSIVNGTALAQFSAAGAYVLRLTATDSVLSSTDDVTITVSAPPVVTITYPPPSVRLHHRRYRRDHRAAQHRRHGEQFHLDDYQLQYRLRRTMTTATGPRSRLPPRPFKTEHWAYLIRCVCSMVFTKSASLSPTLKAFRRHPPCRSSWTAI
jgi:hypothetical protein